MPKNGANTVIAIMPVTNLSILFRRIGITMYTYRIITAKTITPDAMTQIGMMMPTIGISIRSEKKKHAGIMMIIMADTMIEVILGAAMTSTEVSTIREMVTEKKRIGKIEKINET